MSSHLRSDVPLVVVGNIPEAAYDFLRLAGDETDHLVHIRQLKAERSLLWACGSKLVVLSYPASHTTYLNERLGYAGTECIAPRNPTAWLSRDILRERQLMDRVVDYAGRERTIQLIPYATTRPFLELAATLQHEYGLTVLLPESPSPEALWLRDFIDTKSGFRSLVGCWLPDGSLPEGFICQDTHVAANAIGWFLANGQTCVAKPDRGQAGLGLRLFTDKSVSREAVFEDLQQEPFLSTGNVVVEPLIGSTEGMSPSLEFYVPPCEVGPPELTYLANQVIAGAGDFHGAVASRELESTPWYPTFRESSVLIAERLQAMGYVGHFDIDAIVDDGGRIYLLEVNSRRTGGTHVHEFGLFALGPNYLDEVVLLSHDALSSGGITSTDVLLEVMDDLLYPISGDKRGMVITITSTLPAGKFGCIFVAPTMNEALTLQESVIQRVRRVTEGTN